MVKYIKIWATDKTVLNLKRKKSKMECDLYDLTGNRINIPMTKLLESISGKTIFFNDWEIKSFNGRRFKV